MKNKKWLAYYRDSSGYREGTEYIWAPSRADALRIYRTFFNVPQNDDVVVIPVFG